MGNIFASTLVDWKHSFLNQNLVAEKISCFEIINFRILYTLTIYSSISKIRLLIQITLFGNARIQRDQSKNTLREKVQIRSFFWSAFSCIQTEYRKIRTGKNPVFGQFPCSYNHFSTEEAKNFIPCTTKRKKVRVEDIFALPHASNFIMETEDNSIQRQLYDSSII